MTVIRFFIFLKWLFRRRFLLSGLVGIESLVKFYLRYRKRRTKNLE